ncbi:hypothetical protein KIW84_063471 [Lathyrus oleraceus]|uniref:Uncharacterized protein n=1 Tax=Pisum sativum TaxID=3888 RepID=A0A9D4W915_PEA|nr:hypothetical protein KIW84_063471 [Pisum sativum]
MPARDGVAIGLLLNTKGIMAVILLNIAWDKRIWTIYFHGYDACYYSNDCNGFSLINAIYNQIPIHAIAIRTVQKLRFDVELRIVACVHNAKHANNMIHVIEATNATRLSPIHVSVAHLVQLTRHGTILVSQMIIQTARLVAQKQPTMDHN